MRVCRDLRLAKLERLIRERADTSRLTRKKAARILAKLLLREGLGHSGKLNSIKIGAKPSGRTAGVTELPQIRVRFVCGEAAH